MKFKKESPFSSEEGPGVDRVVIDDGSVRDQIRKIYPDGVQKVLELIGTRTLSDSPKCIAPKGMVCMTGILGDEWAMKDFTPMGDIPSLGRLTVYMGESISLSKNLLQEFIGEVEKGNIRLNIDTVYNLDQIAEAHQYMEANKANGKIVVNV